MARRKASRGGYAKPVGAALIALGLLIGVSLVPQQTAAAPRFLAARLGQGFGAGVAALPGLCLLAGLIFFVRERFRLSARVSGILLGYLVALVGLHLRYPAGYELLAAAGRKGGGYVGALLEMALRRTLGEPGLWTATALGALVSVVLLSGASFTDVLSAVLRGGRTLGGALAGVARGFSVWTVAAGVAALRAGGTAAARAAQRGTAGMRAIASRLLTAAASGAGRVLHRMRSRPGAGRSHGEVSGLDPVLASAGGTAVAQASRSVGAGAAAPRASGSHVASPSADTDVEGEDPPGPAGGEPSDPSGPQMASGAAAGAPGQPGASAAEPGSALAPDEVRPGRGDGARSRGEPGRRRRAKVEQETLGFPPEPPHAYALPDLSLLDAFPAGKGRAGKVDPEEVARSLEKTLASFGVDAKVVRWEAGPVVTRYELQPAPGVKVQKITSLQNDIALALAASSVRLEAPIPGKSAVGVELPNERPSLVHLREVLSSEEFRSSPSPLAVAVGKGTAGHPIVADLVAMPHLLIAGATGAGKSVTINSMIASILFRSTPEQARFLMIDPKRVELTNYNGIPHLLSPVVTAPREAAAKLRWAIQEMESRYEMFAAEGVRNIQAFNAQHADRPLAYLLIIVDELADLMMIAPADFEEIICRLAQMTRATGIHLLVATQRPSVDVITGLIKANIPSRIAFSVTSQVDSRTILDHPGAERLLGRGDMLFSPIGASRPTRVQGAFISDAETERLVEFWRAQGTPAYVDSLVQAGGREASEDGPADDALLVDAARLVVRAGYASVSLLQRKMRIGYVRAARVVDQLEEKGVVGPTQGSNPREVLVGVDDLERILRAGAPRAAASRNAAPDDA